MVAHLFRLSIRQAGHGNGGITDQGREGTNGAHVPPAGRIEVCSRYLPLTGRHRGQPNPDGFAVEKRILLGTIPNGENVRVICPLKLVNLDPACRTDLETCLRGQPYIWRHPDANDDHVALDPLSGIELNEFHRVVTANELHSIPGYHVDASLIQDLFRPNAQFLRTNQLKAMVQQLNDRNIEPPLAAFVRKLDPDETTPDHHDVARSVHCIGQGMQIVRVFSHEVDVVPFDALNRRVHRIRTGGQYKLFVTDPFPTVQLDYLVLAVHRDGLAELEFCSPKKLVGHDVLIHGSQRTVDVRYPTGNHDLLLLPDDQYVFQFVMFLCADGGLNPTCTATDNHQIMLFHEPSPLCLEESSLATAERTLS